MKKMQDNKQAGQLSRLADGARFAYYSARMLEWAAQHWQALRELLEKLLG